MARETGEQKKNTPQQKQKKKKKTQDKVLQSEVSAKLYKHIIRVQYHTTATLLLVILTK